MAHFACNSARSQAAYCRGFSLVHFRINDDGSVKRLNVLGDIAKGTDMRSAAFSRDGFIMAVGNANACAGAGAVYVFHVSEAFELALLGVAKGVTAGTVSPDNASIASRVSEHEIQTVSLCGAVTAVATSTDDTFTHVLAYLDDGRLAASTTLGAAVFSRDLVRLHHVTVEAAAAGTPMVCERVDPAALAAAVDRGRLASLFDRALVASPHYCRWLSLAMSPDGARVAVSYLVVSTGPSEYGVRVFDGNGLACVLPLDFWPDHVAFFGPAGLVVCGERGLVATFDARGRTFERRGATAALR